MDSKTNKKLFSFFELSSFSLRIVNEHKKSFIMPFMFMLLMFAGAVLFIVALGLILVGSIGGGFSFIDEKIFLIAPIIMSVLFILFRVSGAHIVKSYFQSKEGDFNGFLSLLKRSFLWFFIFDFLFYLFIAFLSDKLSAITHFLSFAEYAWSSCTKILLSIIIFFIYSYLTLIMKFVNDYIIFFGVNPFRAINQVRILTKNESKFYFQYLLSLLVNFVAFVLLKFFCADFLYGLSFAIVFSFIITVWNNVFCSVMFLNLYDVNGSQNEK